jgi:hypothetical protein
MLRNEYLVVLGGFHVNRPLPCFSEGSLANRAQKSQPLKKQPIFRVGKIVVLQITNL